MHYLLKNICKNGWSQLARVFPVAFGALSDILQVWGRTGASLVKGWASIPENYVTQVPVLSFDRVPGDSLHGKRELILVDIEGAEYMMLQGAVNALRNKPKPIWVVEISTNEHQLAGTEINPHFACVFERFLAEGYRAFSAVATGNEITGRIAQQIVRRA